MIPILIYWALPSLVTLLVLSISCRIEGDPLFQEGADDYEVIILSIVYPGMWIIFIVEVIKHYKVTNMIKQVLTKERSFRGS